MIVTIKSVKTTDDAISYKMKTMRQRHNRLTISSLPSDVGFGREINGGIPGR